MSYLQGACVGCLHFGPQYCHPAHGLSQGVLASCAPADGTCCWVSYPLNTGNVKVTHSSFHFCLHFLSFTSVSIFCSSVTTPLLALSSRGGTVCRDVMPHSLLEVYRQFGGICCFSLTHYLLITPALKLQAVQSSKTLDNTPEHSVFKTSLV